MCLSREGEFNPGFPRWLLPIAEKSNTIGIPKAIPTRSCHDRLGSAPNLIAELRDAVRGFVKQYNAQWIGFV